MKRIPIYVLIITLILAGCQAGGMTPQAGKGGNSAPSLALQDCEIISQGFVKATRARCGTLTVPENRANPAGRKIGLNIAVVPAVSRSPKPDPVFLLAGGPGQAAVELVSSWMVMLERIHQERDLVLVDQRGTGKSNPLECKLPKDDYDISEEQAARMIIECSTKFEADLTQYVTPIAMQDLDEVRAALGYEQINLYGVSYGTRAALTYLRMFPQRVRTITLDAVVSPDDVIFLNTPKDAQRALDLLFARCKADAACQAAFPNLQIEYARLIDRLRGKTERVKMAHPLTGKPIEFNLTSSALTNAVFSLLYTPETASLLPLTIHQAASGDFAPLFTQSGAMDAGLYTGMFYAVICSEDAPHLDAVQASGIAAWTLFSDTTPQVRRICEAFPKATLPADFRAPLKSDVPALLLSGEADPITPPVYAAEVAKQLTNSLHVIAPYQGHGITSAGCVGRLVTDFIKNGSKDGLDAACVKKLQPVPFFISLTGSMP
ncbi:MAG TPA: alpha/beta hydrolase [Anaerolineaceae bacterium]